MQTEIQKAKEAFDTAFHAFVQAEQPFSYIKGEGIDVSYIPTPEAVRAEKEEFFRAYII